MAFLGHYYDTHIIVIRTIAVKRPAQGLLQAITIHQFSAGASSVTVSFAVSAIFH
jgi:hypothetical protein